MLVKKIEEHGYHTALLYRGAGCKLTKGGEEVNVKAGYVCYEV